MTSRLDHDDVMARIANVEIRSNDTLNIAKNNEIIINDILKKKESLKKELNTKIREITQKVKKDLQIPNFGKIEAQMKGILIEMEDLRNRSMQSNLIIKGIQESPNEKWEDTSEILGEFIRNNLNLPYPREITDMQISRAHPGKANSRKSNKKLSINQLLLNL